MSRTYKDAPAVKAFRLASKAVTKANKRSKQRKQRQQDQNTLRELWEARSFRPNGLAACLPTEADRLSLLTAI